MRERLIRVRQFPPDFGERHPSPRIGERGGDEGDGVETSVTATSNQGAWKWRGLADSAPPSLRDLPPQFLFMSHRNILLPKQPLQLIRIWRHALPPSPSSPFPLVNPLTDKNMCLFCNHASSVGRSGPAQENRTRPSNRGPETASQSGQHAVGSSDSLPAAHCQLPASVS
jgi:hypothetical protein